MKDIGTESVMVLLSGGIDSSALVHYYISRKIEVVGLHIQYSQESYKSELESAKKVAEYYNIQLAIINIGFSLGKNNYEYFCRNALFVLAAASKLPKNTFRISLGIHSGVEYYDCSEKFLSDMQNIMNGYFKGTVTIEAPFISLTKPQIFEYCKLYSIPLDFTYSCESTSTNPCGKCPSCKDRRQLNESTRNL